MKVRPVTRCRARCDKAASETAPMACVGASIIVYSVDEQDSLARLLPQLLAQDYDGEFEVIVVNEGDSAGVRDVVETLQTTHRNLYLTHTPDGARNLSRKKLALTLGIKAARYPVAVLTGATAILPGNRWLRAMMSHFSDSNHTGVVLGYACADPYEDTALGARTRSFDFVADSVMWLSDALKGRPWRGTEYNLAYRRELFFSSKGFSSNLNLRYGDDDIFVSRIA
ncbi:MAG: glycosyltransferase, partial [Muribaculaceae bacterium]|nr:glycosyltransferase [Muribaculaceae bacterium]